MRTNEILQDIAPGYHTDNYPEPLSPPSLQEAFFHAQPTTDAERENRLRYLYTMDFSSSNVLSVAHRLTNPDLNTNDQSVLTAFKETYMPLDFKFDSVPEICELMDRPKNDVGVINNAGQLNEEEMRRASLLKGYADVYRATEDLPDFAREAYCSYARAYYLADLIPDGGNVSDETLRSLAGPIEDHVNRTPDNPIECNGYVLNEIYTRNNYDAKIEYAVDKGHELDYIALGHSDVGTALQIKELADEKGWGPITFEELGISEEAYNKAVESIEYQPGSGLYGYGNEFADKLDEAGVRKEFTDEIRGRVNDVVEAISGEDVDGPTSVRGVFPVPTPPPTTPPPPVEFNPVPTTIPVDEIKKSRQSGKDFDDIMKSPSTDDISLSL